MVHPTTSPNGGAGIRDPVRAAERGIDLCRRGEWDLGVGLLMQVAAETGGRSLPSLAYSYLGYGIARGERRRIDEGLKLCRHAVKIEFFQPENYLNLARTCILAGERGPAVRALKDGLKIDPRSEEMLTLQRELGVRRGPVLSFLSRDNPVNRTLGWLRHQITRG
jgi:hypothetical protein